MKHSIAVIQFPGNNCEIETARAVRRSGMDAEIFRWNRPASELDSFDGFVLGGGFAYEDRGRAGVIAAQDPLMRALRRFAEQYKPILGICNGAQALVEAGFIPGVKSGEVSMALARNKRVKDGHVLGTGYYNAWTQVKHTAPEGRCAFTIGIPEKTITRVPVAHGEGRFTTEDMQLFEQVVGNNQVVFRYCNEAGAIIDEFPTNPNGAIYNSAAICNPAGNVLAIMPHPERGVTPPFPGIFDSMRRYIENGNTPYQSALPLTSTFQEHREQYRTDPHAFEILVDLIIADNEAYTIESALHRLGFTNVHLHRRTYWRVSHGPKPTIHPETLAEMTLKTGALFNPNKEHAFVRCVDRICRYSFDDGLIPVEEHPHGFACIIFDKEDSIGRAKHELLKENFGLDQLTEVHRGIYWGMDITGENPEKMFREVLDTHLLHNPHSQECVVVS